MRRLVLTLLFVVSALFMYGQKSVEAIFEQYAGSNGFVTVTINGNLLKLAESLDDDIDNDHSWPLKITQIRILAQEDEHMKVNNFYNQVMKEINRDQYEEFMRVKESDQELIMLVRMEGNIFSEFLLVGGGKDNLLIQIKGRMTLEEAKEFSSEAKKNHGGNVISKYN